MQSDASCNATYQVIISSNSVDDVNIGICIAELIQSPSGGGGVKFISYHPHHISRQSVAEGAAHSAASAAESDPAPVMEMECSRVMLIFVGCPDSAYSHRRWRVCVGAVRVKMLKNCSVRGGRMVKWCPRLDSAEECGKLESVAEEEMSCAVVY